MSTKIEASDGGRKRERCFEDLAASIASDQGDLQAEAKWFASIQVPGSPEVERPRGQGLCKGRAGEGRLLRTMACEGLVSTVNALDRALAIIGHEQRGSPSYPA